MTRSLLPLFIFCIGIFSIQSTYGQGGDLPPNAKAGKCYAKCIIPAKPISYTEETYPIYIGDNPKIKTTELVIALELKEGEEKYRTLSIPKKIQKVPEEDIEYKSFLVAHPAIPEGLSEWSEVLCASEITPDWLEQLNKALINNGYHIDDQNLKILSEQTKKALMDFQRRNNFLVGGLDKETLSHLGLKY